MNKKGISLGRVIRPLLITILLIFLFVKTQNGKLVLLPFLVCSFASLGKNMAVAMEKPNTSKIFDKIFIGSFLAFWFGILLLCEYQEGRLCLAFVFDPLLDCWGSICEK